MLRRKNARILIFSLVAAAIAGSIYAQAYARLALTVVDANDEPLPGVKITVTCDALPEFEEGAVTSKRGRVSFAFVDGTQTYNFKFELEGYNPTTTTIKPEVRTTSRRKYIMETVGTPDVQPEEGKIVYTPAEETFNEGVTQLKEGNLAAAREKFLAALELDSKLTLAHSALAGVYLEEKNYEAAIASAQKVIDAEPQNPRSYRVLYEAHRALGNEDEAKKAFKALEELGDSRDSVAMIYNEGVAALKLGDASAAEERFLEALRLDPGLHQANEGLALVYGNRGKHQQAVEYAEKALAVEPDDKTMMRIRYNAYKGLGNDEKAQEAFAALAAADPTALAGQLYEQGTEAFNAGKTQEALELFKEVIAADPNHARAHYQLGLCYVNVDDKAKAKEHLQKFIELAQPNDPELEAAKSMLSYLG